MRRSSSAALCVPSDASGKPNDTATVNGTRIGSAKNHATAGAAVATRTMSAVPNPTFSQNIAES